MMMDYIQKSKDHDFCLLTECGLTEILQAEHPDKNFVGSCTICRYMKSNTLEDVLRVLENPRREDEVILDPQVSRDARRCIKKMFDYIE